MNSFLRLLTGVQFVSIWLNTHAKRNRMRYEPNYVIIKTTSRSEAAVGSKYNWKSSFQLSNRSIHLSWRTLIECLTHLLTALNDGSRRSIEPCLGRGPHLNLQVAQHGCCWSQQTNQSTPDELTGKRMSLPGGTWGPRGELSRDGGSLKCTPVQNSNLSINVCMYSASEVDVEEDLKPSKAEQHLPLVGLCCTNTLLAKTAGK